MAELPEENQDLEFLWEFIDLPENSVLENINLRIGNDNSSVIFTPDAPGLYSLNVSIFQYNDEVSNQSFTYEIQSDEDSQQISNKIALNDTTVNDLDTAPKDSIQKIESKKWYDSEIAAQAVEEIKTNENKNVFTPTPQPNRTANHPAKRKRSPAPGSPPPSRCCSSTGSLQG